MSPPATVEGVDELVQAWREAAKTVRAGVPEVVESTAVLIRDEAKTRVPERTGDLAGSITYEMKGNQAAEVGPEKAKGWHAHFVERGTPNKGPREFIRPAADIGEKHFNEGMQALVEKAT